MSKKLLIIIGIPALLLLGGYLYLRFSLESSINKTEKKTGVTQPIVKELGGKKVSGADLRPLFITKLQQVLSESSNGLYKVSVGDLQPDLLSSSLLLKDVVLNYDSTVFAVQKKAGTLPDNVFSISFKSLLIEGINLDDAITSKTMDYKLVKLVQPRIILIHGKAPEKEMSNEDFAGRFLKQMKKLSIQQLIIEDGTVVVQNAANNKKSNQLNSVSVVMTNILLDSASRKIRKGILFSETATIQFKNFVKPTADGLYNLKIGKVTIREPQQTVSLANVSFTSPYGRKGFVRKQKFSKELYSLNTPAVTIAGLNWFTLMNEEELVADAINMERGSLSIYLDRSLPPKSKMGNFPNQLLLKLPMKINVAKVNISNMNFAYSEYNPISQQTGTMYLNKLKLSIKNVSNNKQNPQPVIAIGSGLLMNKVPVKANFIFDMAQAKSGKFSAQLKVAGFDGAVVNPFAMPMGMVKTEEGIVHSAEGKITGNELKAAGKVFIAYSNLKLHLLEKDKGEAALDKKGFTTLVANLFVLKKNNPVKGPDARREDAEFVRLPEGGFFTLIWKTILVGILKTIGAPEKMAYKTINSQAKK
ncbi:MAG: hypothetical protein V4676_02575 [Bacteroidota bacterium]